MMALAVFLGVLTWSLLEYFIHRYMGHDRRFRKSLFGVEHVRHHIEGDYFAPTWKKVLVAGFVLGLVGVIAAFAAGRALGLAYTFGLAGFYAFYEVLHRLEHTWAGFGPYGRWARAHHFYHHFVDARVNHGVTSPVWDLVFGTYRRPGVIKVPHKLCMRWLKDPRTAEAWADVFVVGDATR